MSLYQISAVEDAFRAAILSRLGHAPPNIVAKEKMQRFSSNGKKGDKSGWYKLHLDERPAGVFGCYRTGITETWSYQHGLEPMGQAEREAFRVGIEARQRKEAEQRAAMAGRAERVAANLWGRAENNLLVVAKHPYLIRKRVGGVGTRVIAAGDALDVMTAAGMKPKLPEGHNLLLVPMYDVGGQLRSVQLIDEAGGKRFLSGTVKRGLFCAFGGKKFGVVERQRQTVDVAEGYATAATVQRCRGNLTVAAFDSGNLVSVVGALLGRYPNLLVVVIADDDRKTAAAKPELGNPGLNAARAVKAAYHANVTVMKPLFPPSAPLELSDFNDLVNFVETYGLPPLADAQ